MYSEDELKFFDYYGVKRPSHEPHGVNPDNIAENLRKLRPYSWRLEGNKLIGMTDMGPLVQTIDPSKILVGTDKDGLPVFKDVEVQK